MLQFDAFALYPTDPIFGDTGQFVQSYQKIHGSIPDDYAAFGAMAGEIYQTALLVNFKCELNGTILFIDTWIIDSKKFLTKRRLSSHGTYQYEYFHGAVLLWSGPHEQIVMRLPAIRQWHAHCNWPTVGSI